MHLLRFRNRFFILCCAVAAAVGVASLGTADDTELDRYVKKPDTTYTWKVAKTVEGNPSTTFVVHLKSQSWRTQGEVDRTVWEHWLTVVRPEKVTSKKAFLMIGGGSNDGRMPEQADAMIRQIAESTNTVVGELRMIPNQPLVFHGDGKPRKEDDLIAYCWSEFLKTGDATWLPRLPMVKSVVRAMDSMQELMKSEQGGGVAIDKFVVAGASKRGWTTWMAGAVDPRIAAIIPIVIDVVNVDPSMRHHAEVYGFWAKSIGDYVHHHIMERWDDPRLRQLYEIEDPYYYRDRLTMPKYIVNASGDQFFVPDSSQFYFDSLQGEKHLRYVPNADHSLRGTDALETIVAFYQMILNDKPRPRISWTFEPDAVIRVSSQPSPKAALLWHATNPKARDFRLATIGQAYTSQELAPGENGEYVARAESPPQGWAASFVELTYDIGTKSPLKLTTAVRVLPDELPHAGIDPKRVPYEP